MSDVKSPVRSTADIHGQLGSVHTQLWTAVRNGNVEQVKAALHEQAKLLDDWASAHTREIEAAKVVGAAEAVKQAKAAEKKASGAGGQ